VIWFAIPTANAEQCGTCFGLWKSAGYRTAALANGPACGKRIANADIVIHEPEYRGWSASINHLAFLIDRFAWLVTGGDDVTPDPTLTADDIGQRATDHFKGTTMGVMQPAGDAWMLDAGGRNVSHRICWSPWIGREFARNWNGGNGPLCEAYHHFFADEELYEVTRAAVLLWNPTEITHRHEHWTRRGEPRPAYMEAVSQKWVEDSRVFELRKANGFPEWCRGSRS
jgi:hypothetical protein